MKFKLKKSLIGVAALSLIAPVASHAVNDGFNRSTKDGRGSTCVSSSNPSNAAEAAACAEAAKEAAAAAQAEAATRKAAEAEAAAAAQAAREAAVMAVEPGSALKPGDKGAYVSHGSAAPIRDGFGRACVKDGRWNPAMATEECDPDLHNLYRSKAAAKPNQELAPRVAAEPPEAVRETSTQLQQSDLAPRISAPPPERVVSPAAAAAVGAAATGAAVAAAKAGDSSDEIAAFVPPPGADDEDDAGEVLAQEFGEDEEVTPDMMLSEADRTLEADDAALLAAIPLMDDDDADEADDDRLDDLAEDDEVTPDMMLSEADRTLDGDESVVALAALDMDDDDDDYDDGPLNDDDDEDTTPDMMLSENDRRLDDDDIGMLAAVPVDDDDDDSAANADDDDDEVTPEMMLSDADRTLEGEEISPGVATLTDTSPGIAPPPEKVVEDKPIIDNNLPVFPENKQQVADAKPASKPTSLPVTIDVKEDGLFDFDRAVLKSETVSKLDAVADMLRDSKYDAVSIVGHADPIGSESYNQGLSQRRAEAARKYLIGKGIDPSRVRVAAKGESDLVVARADCSGLRKQALIDCLQPNRRVVVEAAGTK